MCVMRPRCNEKAQYCGRTTALSFLTRTIARPHTHSMCMGVKNSNHCTAVRVRSTPLLAPLLLLSPFGSWSTSA